MNGIYINLTDKNGEEVYDLINEYRFSKKTNVETNYISESLLCYVSGRSR